MIETKAFMSKDSWEALVKAQQEFECEECGEKLSGYEAVREHSHKEGHHTYKQQGGEKMLLNVG